MTSNLAFSQKDSIPNWKIEANKLLLKAASHGQYKSILSLLNRGADINTKSEFGNTAYGYAIRNNFEKVAFVLKINGADTNITFKNNRTDLLIIPYNDTTSYQGYDIDADLIYQVYNNNLDSVLLLLKQGANPNANDTYEDINALMYATSLNNLKAVKILINAGANINYKPYYNTPAFIEAIIDNYYDIVLYFIKKGVDINQVDDYGATALHYASGLGYTDFVKLLIQNNADVNKKSKDGNTPIDLATITNNSEIINLLIKNGASIDSLDNKKNTPLITASEYDYPNLVDFYLNNGINYKIFNNYGYDAFLSAVRNGNTDVSEMIFRKDSLYFLKNEDKKILFNSAYLSENRNQVKQLKQFGFKDNILPKFNKMFLGNGVILTLNDVLFNFTYGIKDYKYNTLISLNFASRFWRKRVLYQIKDNHYYQFWENRSILSLDFDKRFNLFYDKQKKYQYGAFGGFKYLYTFGRYKGVNQKVKKDFIPSPKIGLFYNNKNFTTQLSYEYYKFNVERINPNKINLSFMFYFNSKPDIYNKKTILWF